MRGTSSSGSVRPFGSATGLRIRTSVICVGENPTSFVTASRTDSMSAATRIGQGSYSAGKWIRKCAVKIVFQLALGPWPKAGVTKIAAMKNAAVVLALVPFIAKDTTGKRGMLNEEC